MAKQAIRVVLSTGKKVILEKLKISHSEVAVQNVAARSNGDANVLQLLMQKELIKNLILEIDGKRPTAIDREDMDNLFEMGEYNQLLQAVKKMSGDDDLGKQPQLEVVSFGDK